jgi:hypothetical protein
MAKQCYVSGKSVGLGRWYSRTVRKKNHLQETKFMIFLKANHDPNARSSKWDSNFKAQENDTQVAFP